MAPAIVVLNVSFDNMALSGVVEHRVVLDHVGFHTASPCVVMWVRRMCCVIQYVAAKTGSGVQREGLRPVLFFFVLLCHSTCEPMQTHDR